METTRRGISAAVQCSPIVAVRVRQSRLRWPVSRQLARRLPGQRFTAVHRRGKYLLLQSPLGTVIIHLGMSGSLRIVAAEAPADKHDHVDIVFADGLCLRLHDPRRFGAVLWASGDPLRHPLLEGLGPEPWADAFSAAYLHARAHGRRVAVKHFLMDARTVVGVGNIYANEALFRAGIHPARPAGRVSRRRFDALVGAVRETLEEAITQGGTSLRDFVDGQGRPGYFGQSLSVYGRSGEPCPACGSAIRMRRLGQRSAFYCPRCQR